MCIYVISFRMVFFLLFFKSQQFVLYIFGNGKSYLCVVWVCVYQYLFIFIDGLTCHTKHEMLIIDL